MTARVYIYVPVGGGEGLINGQDKSFIVSVPLPGTYRQYYIVC